MTTTEKTGAKTQPSSASEQEKKVKTVGISKTYNHHVNPFTSKYELFKFFGLCKKDAELWRLVEPVQGEIHGLPGSRGTLLATNGMLCIISKDYSCRSSTFEGHLDYFVEDNGSRQITSASSIEVFEIGAKVKAARTARQALAVEEILNLLDL